MWDCGSMQANGAAIRAIRERTGLSKTDLARLTEMDPTHLHRIENGTRNGTEKQIVAIATVLKVPTIAVINSPVEAGK